MTPRTAVPVLLALALPALALPALATTTPASGATERRLYSDEVDASSFLWNDWNKFQENYHPAYVADDDPRTAWTEGAATSGAGEWIRLKLTELAGTSRVRLRIRNGYQKSASLFAANARIKEVKVRLLPSGEETSVTLADRSGWQEIAVEQPVGPLEGVELRAVSVFEGTKYKDLCISDVQVFATSITRENPTFEKDKRARLIAWKEGRLKAAKLFSRAAGKDLPLRPAYQVTQREVPGIDDLWTKCERDWRCHTREALAVAAKDKEFVAAFGAALPQAVAAAAEVPAGFVPARFAPSDKRKIPAVDGLYVPPIYYGLEGGYGMDGFELPILGTIAALRGESLRPLEIQSKVTLTAALDAAAPGCNSKKGTTYGWISRGKTAGEPGGPDLLRAMVVVQCGKIEVRDGTTETAQYQVLVFDDAGDLSLLAGPGYVTGYTWEVDGDRRVLAGGRRVVASGSRDVLAYVAPVAAVVPAAAPR